MIDCFPWHQHLPPNHQCHMLLATPTSATRNTNVVSDLISNVHHQHHQHCLCDQHCLAWCHNWFPLHSGNTLLAREINETLKMENYPVRVSGIGQFYADCMADRKSRFCQIDNQPSPRSEVICPQPHRATRLPCLINTLTRVSSKTKGMKSIYRVDCAPEILDLLLNQDYDSDTDGFFSGSPPMRTNNPVIQDAQFVKQSYAASLRNSPSGNPARRVERGSPTCGSSFGGSPKVRIEGFACGSSEKHRVAAALA